MVWALQWKRLSQTCYLKGERRIPICVLIQNKLGLAVQPYFASEKWKWHQGHEYRKPVPLNVSCLVMEELLMLVDYFESLVLLQVLGKKTLRMEEVVCH